MSATETTALPDYAPLPETARGPALKADDYPTAASVIDRWAMVERSMRTLLASLTDADLDRSVEFAFGGGPTHVRTVGHLLQHAAIHGVHHRGQVALLLRALGHAPGNVDFLFFQHLHHGFERVVIAVNVAKDSVTQSCKPRFYDCIQREYGKQGAWSSRCDTKNKGVKFDPFIRCWLFNPV